MKNYILTGVVALIVGVVLGYATHGQPAMVGSASPSGTSQGTISYVGQTVSASAISTTTGTFALYNNGYDHAITGGVAYCTGLTGTGVVGQANFAVTAATSTVATTTSTSYALNMTIATTTATTYVASTTYPNDVVRLWPANTYLVFSFNATDTAVCTVGVNFLSL